VASSFTTKLALYDLFVRKTLNWPNRARQISISSLRMNFVRTITFAIAMAVTGSYAATEAPQQTTAAAPQAELVDINHATLVELKTLPGVGEAYALAIIKHRPYKNKTQLRSKGAIPLAAYRKIKNQIIAKQ
jgi:DNA uptake protein ComE-like DNA-binding protein